MIFVKDLDSENPFATQVLVRLTGDLENKYGEFAVVSYSTFSRETCVFPCDENGKNINTRVVIDETGEDLEEYLERKGIR
jgi:hypothetical protein